MRKTLLFILAGALASGTASADQFYTYSDIEGYPLSGAARRVSPNGQWVVGGDDTDETGSFIIDTNSPADYEFTDEGLLVDINDSGVAVGCWFRKEGYAKYHEAAYYKDGIWVTLPLPDEIIGQSEAVSITPDSKLIIGHGMCRNEDPDEPGKYFPMTWQYNDATEEYELLHLYNNLYLPGTYGFYVQDMTPSGTHACGFMGLNMGDNIGVVLNLATGELKYANQIEEQMYWFELTHPVTGADMSGYFPTQFVDGYMDGIDDTKSFKGGFYYATDGYIFGARDIVTDVQEDGSGTITTVATVYDIANDKYYDGKTNTIYMCGDSPQLQFTSNGTYIYAGAEFSVNTDFDVQDADVCGIYAMDTKGEVLVGSRLYSTPLVDGIESPAVMILDKGIAGIQEVGLDPEFTADVKVEGHRITVTGAKEVAIFSINGSVLAQTTTLDAAPGVYIVMADGKSAKVIVK